MAAEPPTKDIGPADFAMRFNTDGSFGIIPVLSFSRGDAGRRIFVGAFCVGAPLVNRACILPVACFIGGIISTLLQVEAKDLLAAVWRVY